MRYSLLTLSLLLLSCGGNDNGGVTAPDTGSLEIRASTSGEAGADYMVTVDSESGQVLAPNGVVTVSDLEPGFHVVQIAAPPPGCTVAGDNPRTVSVAAGATNVVTFAVTCVPLLGAIQVTTATTGAGPAAYDLVMDGISIGPIGSSATRTIDNVPPGTHAITLGSIPPECQIQGTVPQTVAVEPSSSATVAFTVTCTGPPSTSGTLDVTVGTSGADVDPDGYQVVMDRGAPQPIGINATLTIPSVTAGDHSVRLDGIASNCSVSGPNPQTVTVPASGSATLIFAVTCTTPQPTTGTLRISTTTSGSDVDPDGYTVMLDGDERGEIGNEDSRTLGNLTAGEHTVELTGVAGNCEVEGDNPRTVTVTSGEQAEAGFVVTCRADTGGLSVITETSGSDPDDNGYILTLDDEELGQIGNNGDRTITDLIPSDYSVELGDVAENCEVAGENPRTVTVRAGETVEARFDVTCAEVEDPTGSIQVVVTTEGAPDEEFALTLDEEDPQLIEPDGELTLEVSVGSHELLLEVAANCTVTDEATRTVEITAGDTEEVTYSVECTEASAARR